MREDIRRLLNWRTAFGELLIVIIGVLVALSVNSWWEDRTDRLEEAEHLAALKSEAEQNLVELYGTLAELERLTESTRELIIIVEGVQDVPSNQTLVDLTWNAFSFVQFDPQFTAYDNLLSTGSVRLLTNETLKLELARFRSTAEGLKLLDWQLDQWSRVIQPWAIKNLQLDWLPDRYRRDNRVPEPRVLSDWEAILKDQEFKGIVINRLIAFVDFKVGLDQIRPAAEALATSLGVDVEKVRENAS